MSTLSRIGHGESRLRRGADVSNPQLGSVGESASAAWPIGDRLSA